ncbi:hypothetical protein D3C75_851900 [compost metagenome]
MCDDRSDPPAPWLKQAQHQGLQDQADKTEDLQGVLPKGVDRAANAAEQLDQYRLLGLLFRDAEVLHRAVDRLQQGPAGFRQLGGLGQAR